jgi:hypothetical protein
VDRLSRQFGDRIEFVHLNVDSSATLPLRQQYDIIGRTQYVLVDAEGNTWKRWYGPLNETAITAEIEAFIAEELTS